MNINYELYKIFYHVAKNMSFSKAADKLFVTQSSVSQSIKSLEDQLGISLFFRNGKRISLTNSGEILYEHLETAFHEIITAENYIDSYKSLEVGYLKIGASDTICKHYLMDIFEEFHQKFPKIKLMIDNQPSPKTKIEVLKGQLDLGFINHKNQDIDSKFNYSTFYMLDEIFFTSSHNKYIDNQILTPEDFIKYPFISLKKHTSTRNFIESIFKNYGISIEPEVELISVDLIVDLVNAGFGIGFADRKVIKDSIYENLIIVKTTFDIPKRKISLITNKRAPLNQAAKAFIEIIESRK
ncbi:MAG: LysR family transcriptional regulator [Clostridiales bacterium]|nr:LysR family transcriptional regulator [Clostridiales bacterium]